MVSTYTTNGGIEKIGSGEQSGTWGDTTNTNFDIIDKLTNGVVTIDVASNSSSTLTTQDGTVSDGMSKVLSYTTTGSQSGTHTVTISPNDAQKLYFVKNAIGQTIEFSQGSGANASVPNGESAIIFSNGGGSTAVVTNLSALFPNTNTAGTGTFTSITANGGVTVDNITIDGTEIDLSSGDLTLDVAGNIVLDADGGTVKISDGGTEILNVTNSSSDVIIKPVVDGKDIIFQQRDGTEVARIEDNGTFNVVTDKFAINGTAVTSTAAELNILDDATVTSGELNKLDGDTSNDSSITVADSDGIIVDDNGTIKKVPASDIKTYATAGATSGTVTSIVAGTGLSGGSITSSGTISLNTGIGEVGTYAFLARQGYSTITAGQTYTNSGSGANNNSANLVYAGFLSEGDNNVDDDTSLDSTGSSTTTGLTGIWRAMGSADATSRVAATLFLRIS